MVEHNTYLELFYDGAWQRVPALVRDQAKYTRGNKSFTNDTDQQQGSASIDDTLKMYSPRNAFSVLAGKIGQNTPVRLTSDSSVRITGEVARWSPQLPVKGSAWTELDFGGILRRIGIGTDPIRSALVRAANATRADGLVAYWPLEDGKSASAGVNLVPGGPLMTPDDPTTIQWAGFDASSIPAGVETMPAFAGVTLTGAVTATSTASWRVEFLTCLEAGSIGPSDTLTLAQWFTDGGITRWTLDAGGLLGDYTMSFHGYSPYLNGTPFFASVWSTVPGFGILGRLDDGLVHHLVLEVTQTNSTTLAYKTYYDGVLADSGNNTTGALIGQQQIGPPKSVVMNPFHDLRVLTSGGVGVWSPKPASPISYAAVGGYAGEVAGTRFQRFCDQEGITASFIGTSSNTVPMGPQTTDPLLAQFDLIAATDDASIVETRASAGLTMRTGGSKLNQTEALSLSYIGQVKPPLRPVFGDEGLRNDVTASNPDNTSQRVEQATGPRNTQSPLADPQGVGRYSTTINVNADTALTLYAEAGWRVNQGVYDGTWYASVTIDRDVQAVRALAATIDAVEVGDLIRLRDLPLTDTITDFYGIVIAISESFPPKERLTTFYLIPGDPYRVGVTASDSGDFGAFVGYLETDSCVLASQANAGATSLSVTVTGPTPLSASDDFPHDLVVGSQRVTATAFSAGTYTLSPTAPLTYAAAAGTVVSQYQPIIPTLVD